MSTHVDWLSLVYTTITMNKNTSNVSCGKIGINNNFESFFSLFSKLIASKPWTVNIFWSFPISLAIILCRLWERFSRNYGGKKKTQIFGNLRFLSGALIDWCNSWRSYDQTISSIRKCLVCLHNNRPHVVSWKTLSPSSNSLHYILSTFNLITLLRLPYKKFSIFLYCSFC